FDADAPPLLARRAEQQPHGVRRSGSDARYAVGRRGDVHGVVTEQRANAVNEAHTALRFREPRGAAPGSAELSWSRAADPGPMARGTQPLHSRHACTGTTFPGLTRSSGSNTRRTARMAASASPSKISGMYRSLSSPTPCSPVIVPPAAMHAAMISPLASSTRALRPGTRPSNEMLGCRLPSPAWNTLLTVSP